MKFKTLTSLSEVKRIIPLINNEDIVALDLETNGLNPRKPYSKIIGFSFYLPSLGEGFYIPVGHGYGKLIDKEPTSNSDSLKAQTQRIYDEHVAPDVRSGNIEGALDVLREGVHWDRLTFLMHNATFDVTWLVLSGFPMPNTVLDTMLQTWLLNTDRKSKHSVFGAGNYKLKDIAKQINIPLATVGEKELLANADKMKTRLSSYIDLPSSIHFKEQMWMLPVDDVAYYACIDTWLTWSIYDSLLPALNSWNLRDGFYLLCDIQLKAAIRMHMTGLRFDREAAETMKTEANKRLSHLSVAIINQTAQPAIEERAQWAKENREAQLQVLLDKFMQLAFNKTVKLPKSVGGFTDKVANHIPINFVSPYFNRYWDTLEQNIPIPNVTIDRNSVNGRILQTVITLINTVLINHVKQIDEMFPYIENPSSSNQVTTYLQSKGLDVENADKSVLRNNARDLEVLNLILEYRAINKLLTTYVDKWLNALSETADIYYPTFRVAGTVTGRWSSGDKIAGNIQQIPRDAGGIISPKNLLLPIDENRMLIEVDYTSLETYLSAWVGETLLDHPDKNITKILLDPTLDMHSYTRDSVGIPHILMRAIVGTTDVNEETIHEYARRTFKTIPDDVNPEAWFMKEMRQASKPVNFGKGYGGGGKAMMQSLQTDRDTGLEISRKWDRAYPSMHDALNYYEKLALTPRPRPNSNEISLYVQYPFPYLPLVRRYDIYLPTAKNKNGGKYSPQQMEARNTWNSIIQGIGALITTTSAYRIAITFSDDTMHLHACVHDSNLLSVLPDNLVVLYDVRDIMTDYPVYPTLEVGFDASPVGKSWGDKREIKDLELFIVSKGTEYK